MINFGIDIVEVTQVAFPATAVPSGDPNTLDDYEEGEWDAIVTDGTNDATMNALFTTQRYTKVGRKVHLQGLAAITAVGALAGNVRITGTPFFAAAGGVVDLLGFAQGGNDLGVWGVAEGVIANAALRTLNATPVEVIAAPGAGFAVVIDSAQFMLDFATAGFDGVGATEDIILEYTGALNLLDCDPVTCLDAAAGADAFGYSADIIPVDGFVPVAAAAVDIALLNGEWFGAAGGSALRYSIRYRVIEVDFS